MPPSDTLPPPLAPYATSTVAVTWRPIRQAPTTVRGRALVYGPVCGVHRVRFLFRRPDGVVCGIAGDLPDVFDLRDVFTHWAPDPHPVATPGARHGSPLAFAAVFCALGLVGVAVAGTASPAAAQPFVLGMVVSCVAALVAGFAVSQGAR